MFGFLLIALVSGSCPTAEIPAALTKAGIAYRNCFFGNPEAAKAALREAAKEAGCEQTGDPPVCTCPASVPAGSVDCTNWAVNFVRFYVYDYDARDESPFVDSLTKAVQQECQTHNGNKITGDQVGRVKPDSHLAACQRFQPAATADVAAFTAYMAFAVVSAGFVIFETYETPSIMYKKKT